MTRPPLPPKARLILTLFGVVCGLLCAGALALILQQLRSGRTEFESLDDLRRAMLMSEPVPKGKPAALRDIIQAHARNDIIFDLQSNLSVTFQHQALRTNQCGMRGGPFRPQNRSPQTRRIAFLGDSFTLGWGVAEHESFPEVTARILTEKSGGTVQFAALNYGTPGYSTFQEVARFLEDGIDLDPDLIVVYFIENDFGLPFYVRDLQAPGELISAQHFSLLPWAAKKEQFQEHKTELGFADPNRALTELAKAARKRGIPVYVALNPSSRWKEHVRRLPVLTKRRIGIQLIPLAPLFEKYVTRHAIPQAQLSLQGDPHPSALKHHLVGQILAASLLRHLPLE